LIKTYLLSCKDLINCLTYNEKKIDINGEKKI
jgi:hypothetical protein